MNLPAGWTEEKDSDGTSLITLKHESYGYVTIDMNKRLFCIGRGLPRARPSIPNAHYSGRGWESRIVADAIGYLSGIWNAA